MRTVTERPSSLDPLRTAHALWRKTVEAELQGVPFERKLVSRTYEGVSLQPLYTRADAPAVEWVSRGYGAARWQFCQEIAAMSPGNFNGALRAGLAGGQNAVALRLDRAGRMGCDPDHAVERGQVGVEGVSIADQVDLAAALHGVDLAAVPVYLEAGAAPLPLAALYLAEVRARGVDVGMLSGGLTSDPLAEWAERGVLPAACESHFDDLAGWTRWVRQNVGKNDFATIGVSGAHWLEAGGNAAQELAFTLAAAVAYLRALDERGVPPAEASARMRFRFAVGPQFFMEIAKFRALRALIDRVLAAFRVPATAGRPRVHAVTSKLNTTTLDPHVNLLRVTTEALSAVLGGVDSLHVGAFDDVFGGSDEFSRRIARNLHPILAEEFRLASPSDPAAGSWYVEKLTDELARKAWGIFQEVEKSGGYVSALRAGSLQKQTGVAAAEKNDAVSKRRFGLVGVNLFPNLKELPRAETFAAKSEMRTRRAAEIAGRRRECAWSPPVGDWPAGLAAAIDAATKGATLGQLGRAVYPAGHGDECVSPLSFRRAAEGFEELRAASEAFAGRAGARPRVFLAKMGPVAQHKARADFAAGFFAVGGFEMLAKQNFETAESAALAATESGAPIAVLCSTDETYPVLAPVFVKAAKAVNPSLLVVLAGYPAEQIEALRAAGFDEFIHVRADVRGVLAQLLSKIGAPTTIATP